MAVAHFWLQSYNDFQTCFFFEKIFFRELQIFIIKKISPQRAYHLWMWLWQEIFTTKLWTYLIEKTKRLQY